MRRLRLVCKLQRQSHPRTRVGATNARNGRRQPEQQGLGRSEQETGVHGNTQELAPCSHVQRRQLQSAKLRADAHDCATRQKLHPQGPEKHVQQLQTVFPDLLLPRQTLFCAQVRRALLSQHPRQTQTAERGALAEETGRHGRRGSCFCCQWRRGCQLQCLPRLVWGCAFISPHIYFTPTFISPHIHFTPYCNYAKRLFLINQLTNEL